MNYSTIKKDDVDKMTPKPNLTDYGKLKSEFIWEDVLKELEGFDNGGINIAHEAIDRHIKTPLKSKIALFWEGKKGEREEYTFHDLYKLTNRFANVLKNSGIEKGDRVFTYMDRTPEIYVCILGALKAGVYGKTFPGNYRRDS